MGTAAASLSGISSGGRPHSEMQTWQNNFRETCLESENRDWLVPRSLSIPYYTENSQDPHCIRSPWYKNISGFAELCAIRGVYKKIATYLSGRSSRIYSN